jgi:hypothetical protein
MVQNLNKERQYMKQPMQQLPRANAATATTTGETTQLFWSLT